MIDDRGLPTTGAKLLHHLLEPGELGAEPGVVGAPRVSTAK
jgi:hypothetical protein